MTGPPTASPRAQAIEPGRCESCDALKERQAMWQRRHSFPEPPTQSSILTISWGWSAGIAGSRSRGHTLDACHQGQGRWQPPAGDQDIDRHCSSGIVRPRSALHRPAHRSGSSSQCSLSGCRVGHGPVHLQCRRIPGPPTAAPANGMSASGEARRPLPGGAAVSMARYISAAWSAEGTSTTPLGQPPLASLSRSVRPRRR